MQDAGCVGRRWETSWQLGMLSAITWQAARMGKKAGNTYGTELALAELVMAKLALAGLGLGRVLGLFAV